MASLKRPSGPSRRSAAGEISQQYRFIVGGEMLHTQALAEDGPDSQSKLDFSVGRDGGWHTKAGNPAGYKGVCTSRGC